MDLERLQDRFEIIEWDSDCMGDTDSSGSSI